MNTKYIKVTKDGLTLSVPYKTVNGNYMISDGMYRFISASGKHLRWVDAYEVEYLTKVLPGLEKKDFASFPKEVEERELPCEEIVWQFIEKAEFPELSSNGGSYDFLHRVVKRSGWDREWENGFFLVENHLYGSDFSHQGWNEKGFASESEAISYIERFITVIV